MKISLAALTFTLVAAASSVAADPTAAANNLRNNNDKNDLVDASSSINRELGGGHHQPQQHGYGYHQPGPSHSHYSPTHPVESTIDSKYIDRKLQFGDEEVVFHNGPFKLKAKCVPPGVMGDLSGFANVQLEIMASAMKESILVYGVGYTIIPGLFSERVVKKIDPGASEDYTLFRVSDFFRFTDAIDPPASDPRSRIPQGFVANNPFNGAFSSNNGYHIGIDGDSCTGVVRSTIRDPSPRVGNELDEFYGDSNEDRVDCIISCIIHDAEPKKDAYHNHNPW